MNNEITFAKYHGTGNDFILIDDRQEHLNLSQAQIENLCNRRFGIGGDGLMLLRNSDKADFQMIYYNSDGKESSFCGNGSRCIIAFAKTLMHFEHFSLEFQGLIKTFELLQNEEISVNMGQTFDLKALNDIDFEVETGSPHFVRIVDSLAQFDFVAMARAIRYSDPYPQGINVNLMRIIDANHIEVRTYERGVEDETYSCGTGVTACSLVAMKNFPKSRIVLINTKGGKLQVKKDDKNFVWLTGPAKFIFQAKINMIIFDH
ncbi:MAG: diaminopimelate epimerase [Chitinophagales bacterium]|jgi:diaminopimelate epimerase|nr:diaminopimelate epimerase [Chitinophagales bacterium]